MRRHHTGSGRARRTVVPTDWADHHAGVVEQAVDTAGCVVTVGPASSGPPVFDSGLGYSVAPAGTAVYSGPAEVMAVSNTDRLLVVAEDDVTSQVYRITLPVDAGVVTSDHVVRVSVCDDPLLVGKTLSVAMVDRGSRRFSRVLLATLND